MATEDLARVIERYYGLPLGVPSGRPFVFGKTLIDTTWKVNANQPPRRQDRQEKENEMVARENEKPTLFDPLGDLGVLAVGFPWLTFQVVYRDGRRN
jgi:hypothetical protein